MKIHKSTSHVFNCPLCGQAQSVRLFKGEYTIWDKQCGYSVKFKQPKLVRISSMIASQRIREGSWQCPLCAGSYRLEVIKGGFLVRDDKCDLELTISVDSPMLEPDCL